MTVASVKKVRAAKLSIITAVSLAVVKLLTGVITGSLAVLSSAIDSLLDILMSGVNLFAIQHAEQPADEQHPYGHGKFETLATIFQSVIIAVSGGWIIYEAIQRLLEGRVIKQAASGIVVMAISLVVSFAISRYLKRTAKETDSSALEADALHFSMDVYTNLALLIGLVILSRFHITWLDPAMSILVAIYIFLEAVRLLRHGLRDVLDEQLPDTVRDEIEALIDDSTHELFNYHNLRTRRAGSQKLVDFHLTVCKHLSVEEAHEITDYIEDKLAQKLSGLDVTIHVEPCRKHDCPGRNLCPAQSIRHASDEDNPFIEDNKNGEQVETRTPLHDHQATEPTNR